MSSLFVCIFQTRCSFKMFIRVRSLIPSRICNRLHSYRNVDQKGKINSIDFFSATSDLCKKYDLHKANQQKLKYLLSLNFDVTYMSTIQCWHFEFPTIKVCAYTFCACFLIPWIFIFSILSLSLSLNLISCHNNSAKKFDYFFECVKRQDFDKTDCK